MQKICFTRDDDMDPQALVSVNKKNVYQFFLQRLVPVHGPQEADFFFALYAFLKMRTKKCQDYQNLYNV
jgi:hypothetical protein